MNEARATQTRSVFGMVCCVKVRVLASAPRIWSLLTDAGGFPRWNSTVTSIEGQIREGERLCIRVPGSDRTFTPKVSGVVPNQRMTWAGGLAGIFKGARLFTLAELDDGSTDFAMQENFSGFLLPIVGRWLPDFRPIFERYATDLKREAERVPRNAPN
ncbi:MAG TPA: SRPBCC domain-containing protein [Bryobacteraceae bacterium]|nr:SRPBCC domain-containing protein [Bryobacteraceae bacterium]